MMKKKMGLWVVEEIGDSDFSRPEGLETQGVEICRYFRTIDRLVCDMGMKLCGSGAAVGSLVYTRDMQSAVCAKGMLL